ncbi:MAG: flagellar hook-associated protein FlgK [Pseudomonadota bacterium]
MSDLYSIGLSGVRAYQGALGTVSENIANAQTPGYTKRTTTLSEFGVTEGGLGGSGVRVSGINRTADLYRAADVRRAGADLARSETAVGWLERIETALSAEQVGARITGFFNAATTLAADPSATTPRTALIEAARGVAYAVSASGRSLADLSSQLNDSARDAVTTLNGLAATLAKVNDGLTRSTPNTAAAALLGDQRDQLLERISAIADTAVEIDGFGRASVRLGGSGGPVLIAPDGAGEVGYARNDEGAFAFSLARGATVSALTPGGGALAGLADSAQRIADARIALSEIAKDFVDGVNGVQAGGRDLDGVAGAALFAQDADDSTQLTLVLEDPRKIAAAAPGGGARDNANLLALASLRGTAKFESRAAAVVGANASALSAGRTVAAAQTAIREGAVARYDATAGVDLDNEAVDLLRYQQAYQGCTRVIQVGRECFQAMIDIR